MKRDMDLIRRILILAEECPAGQPFNDFSSLKADAITVAEHVWLLRQAGLLEAAFPGDSPSHGVAMIIRLTPHGHDFIAQAREPVLWDKAKDTAKKAGVGLTVEILTGVLSQLAKGALGLS